MTPEEEGVVTHSALSLPYKDWWGTSFPSIESAARESKWVDAEQAHGRLYTWTELEAF